MANNVLELNHEEVKNNPSKCIKFVGDPDLDTYMLNSCKNIRIFSYYLTLNESIKDIWRIVYKNFNRLNPTNIHIDMLYADLMPNYSRLQFYMDEFKVDFGTAYAWCDDEDEKGIQR